MFIPLLAFLGAVVLSLYLAVIWDSEERRLRTTVSKRDRLTATILGYVSFLWGGNKGHDHQVVPVGKQATIEDASIVFDRKRKARVDFYNKLRACNVGGQHTILEDSLPKVFQTAVFTSKMWAEIQRHHKWISLIFHYSDNYPRFLRVLALTTNIVTHIFFIALTYSVLNPETDPGSCAAHADKHSCLEPRSKWHTGQPQCEWSSRDSACRFVQPNLLVRVILFCMLFSCLLAVPVDVCTNYIFRHILAAPTIEAPSTSSKYRPDEAEGEAEGEGADHSGVGLGVVQNKPAPTLKDSTETLVAAGGAVAPSSAIISAKSHKQRAEGALVQLENEIRRYREVHVKGIVERRRFDRMWGLAPSGHFILSEALRPRDDYLKWLAVRFCLPDRAHVRKQALLGIMRAQRIEEEEVAYLKRHPCTDGEVGRMLLFHLQCDLLPGLSGRILENKGKRDAERTEPVSWMLKVVGAVLILALYGGFLYYVLTFAVEQRRARRSAWFKTFMLFLVFDFVGLSGVHVFVTHYLVPCVAMRKVTAVKEYLMRKMQRVETEVQRQLVAAATKGDLEAGWRRGSSNAAASGGTSANGAASGSAENGDATKPAPESFNAAAFLFAAYRLSCYVPHLRESHMVRLCGDTQNTRQQCLKEIMFGIPKGAPKMPRRAPRTDTAVAEVEEGQAQTALSEALQQDVPEPLVPLLAFVAKLVAWILFLGHFVLWYLFAAFRPLLVVAVTFPEPLQDAVLEVVAVVGLGYLLLLHIMLYEFAPLLAFLPVFVVTTASHFYFTASNGQEQVKMAKLKYATQQAKAEQRKLVERRIALEEQKAEQEIAAAAAAAAALVTPATQDGVSPVHSAIRRSAMLRASFQREAAQQAAAALEQMDLSLQRSHSADPQQQQQQAAEHDSSGGKFESRLQHFLASADKVLAAQQDAHSRVSPHAHSHSSSQTPKHSSHSDHGADRSFPNLRAVDSFYQGKQSTAAPSPMDDAPNRRSEGFAANRSPVAGAGTAAH